MSIIMPGAYYEDQGTGSFGLQLAILQKTPCDSVLETALKKREFLVYYNRQVKQKLRRLGLEVVVRQIQQTTTNESFFNGCYEHPKAPTERIPRTLYA